MMKNSRSGWQWIIVAMALLLVLAACRQDEPTPTAAPPEPTQAPEVDTGGQVEPTEPADTAEPAVEQPEISQPIYRWGEVADRVWVLLAYDDAANPTVVEEGVVITAIFSSIEPTVSGSGGCNNYFTGYESTDEGSLTINGPIAGTMMFCEDSMDAESAYFAALETVSGWSLTEEGRLELAYDTGQPYDQKLVYAPGETPLVGTTWQLVSLGDPDAPQPVEEGTSVTAVFSPETDTTGTVGGNATCNGYSTSYELEGNNISFGPVAGTLALCPVGADQEAAYLAALGSAQTYEIAGANMQITYDGGVLNFTSLSLPLENVIWQATMIAGQPAPDGAEITALFEPGDTAGIGNVGGNSGCNNYNTGYSTSSDISVNPPVHNITIDSPMAMTLAVCPDEALAELERTYLGVLETAVTYEILGDQMVLQGESGEVAFTADRQPLVGTQWRLIFLGSANEQQTPIEGSNFTAQFNRLPTLPSGTVTGETGCNKYNATFAANLTELKVNLPATSRQECGDAQAEAEQQYFLALNAATEYRILGNLLQIPYGESESRQVLVFEATPPPVVDGPLDLTPLDNTFWYLLSIGDNALLPYTEITAGFEINDDGVTGALSGSSGCNAYNTSIGENFAIGPIASTQKACSQEVMAQEGGYLDWLGKAYGYHRAGDQLLISTGNGVLTFNSTPVLDQTPELQNVTWYMVSVGTLEAVPFSNATTIFSADGSTVSGNTGCNEFSGAYRTEPGNKLTISGFAATQSACATEELTKQEEALIIFLSSAVSYSVSGTSMQIQTVDGSVVNYTSIPPADPVPPTATIISEDLGETGQPMAFDGTQSAAGSLPIVRFEWNMGDGVVLNEPVFEYAYNLPGGYEVTLTVTDQAGLTNSTTRNVTITPVVDVTPPTAVVEGPQAAFVGEQVTFSAANAQQGTGAIVGYSWSSGDGYNTGQVPDSSFTTIYYQPGTYYVSVTVADANGLSDTASMAILVNATLEGTNWILQSTIPGTTISLVFENGYLSGFAGCNSYNSSYMTTLAAGATNSITIAPLTSTGALCSPEIMNQEQGYFTTLQSVTSYTISGDSLSLTLPDGTQLLYFAATATPSLSPAQ